MIRAYIITNFLHFLPNLPYGEYILSTGSIYTHTIRFDTLNNTFSYIFTTGSVSPAYSCMIS